MKDTGMTWEAQGSPAKSVPPLYLPECLTAFYKLLNVQLQGRFLWKKIAMESA